MLAREPQFQRGVPGKVGDRDHRGAPRVDRFDDFGVVDALQIDRGDPEVAVPELALDDDQRHPFTGHLDRVGVAQLMRREASAHTGSSRGAPRLGTRPTRRPGTTARAAVDDAEQRTDWQRDPRDEPRVKLLPTPVIHPDLATSSSLAATNEQGTAAAIEVCLTQRKHLVDAKTGAPQHHREPTKPLTVQTIASDAHDRDDFLDGWRVSRIPQALVTRRTAGMKAGHCRRRPATTGGIKHHGSGHWLHIQVRPDAQHESPGPIAPDEAAPSPAPA